jgi:glycosyltransferase involved in cell wall biosynthesis
MPPPPRSVLNIGNFLSRQGVYRSAIEDLSDILEQAGWQVLRTSAVRPRLLRLLDMVLAVWLKRSQYRVAHIHVFSGPAFLWAEITAGMLRLARKPFVLSLHGGNLPVFARRWPGRVRRLLASAACVVAPSQYMLEEFRPLRADLRLVPNALDITRFSYQPRSNPRPILVWVRAFHRIYNPTQAPEVLGLLKARFPQASLIMVGPDTGDGSLQETTRLIAERHLAQSTSIAGGVPAPQIPGYMGQGDIFLNTTNLDNTPLSVLEAMACGLCVVSTNVGGIPFLLTHQVDALLVPPNNPQAMAQAAERILSEPGLAERLSHNARRTAEKFNWATILPAWERLLLEAQDRPLQDL